MKLIIFFCLMLSVPLFWSCDSANEDVIEEGIEDPEDLADDDGIEDESDGSDFQEDVGDELNEEGIEEIDEDLEDEVDKDPVDDQSEP